MKFKTCFLIVFLFICAGISKGQKRFDPNAYPLHVLSKSGTKPMVLFLTGDGGWNSFSQSVAAQLAINGYAVVALDTRNYFWTQKTPNQFGDDAESILTYYMKAWGKSAYTIVGYSFGADVGSFLPGNLSKESLAKLKSLVLLSPGFSTGFVTKITSMLGFGSTDKEPYKIYPELLKSPVPVRCIFGKEEDSDFYRALKPTENIHKVTIPGSHKFNNDAVMVVKAIIPGL